MEQSVGLQSVDRFGEGQAAKQAVPFSGVTVPLDVEAITADPIEASERGVELFAEILREAGAVALNEAIFGAVPLSQYIDWIVELRRPDSGQESRLQEVVDQPLAGGRHRRFICCGQTARSHMCPPGSRRFDMTRHWLSPVPGQKLTEPLDSMIVDAGQHVGKPGLRIDVVELGHSNTDPNVAIVAADRAQCRSNRPPELRRRRRLLALRLLVDILPSGITGNERNVGKLSD